MYSLVMTEKSRPLGAVEAAKEPYRANLRKIAAELAAARQEVARILAKLEEAVVEAEPELGATEVTRAAGISRARVYQLVPKKGAGPQGPKGPRAPRVPKAAE